MNVCPKCNNPHLRNKNKRATRFSGNIKNRTLRFEKSLSSGYYCKRCGYDSNIIEEIIVPKKGWFKWFKKKE